MLFYVWKLSLPTYLFDKSLEIKCSWCYFFLPLPIKGSITRHDIDSPPVSERVVSIYKYEDIFMPSAAYQTFSSPFCLLLIVALTFYLLMGTPWPLESNENLPVKVSQDGWSYDGWRIFLLEFISHHHCHLAAFEHSFSEEWNHHLLSGWVVTDHLRIINEQIRDDVQCCDYLLNEDFCKISVCACVCVYVCLGGVPVCVVRIV